MQTYLPLPDYAETAKVLSNKHLGNQRVLVLQIMQAMWGRRLRATTAGVGPRGGKTKVDLPYEQWTIEYTHVGWDNVPGTKMWEGAGFQLLEYQTAICAEWVGRGFEDTCLAKSEFIYLDVVDYFPTDGTPAWWGNEAFHASHRSALLRQDPKHYGQFGWEEADDLPLVWPTPR